MVESILPAHAMSSWQGPLVRWGEGSGPARLGIISEIVLVLGAGSQRWEHAGHRVVAASVLDKDLPSRDKPAPGRYSLCPI